jgi:hypothetical protein
MNEVGSFKQWFGLEDLIILSTFKFKRDQCIGLNE